MVVVDDDERQVQNPYPAGFRQPACQRCMPRGFAIQVFLASVHSAQCGALKKMKVGRPSYSVSATTKQFIVDGVVLLEPGMDYHPVYNGSQTSRRQRWR